MNFELLDKPLFTLLPSELEEIKTVADVLFTRLCRPFQLTTARTVFSYDKTIRSAMKLGEFLPQYDKVHRHTNKSRLVIAMSLSGIDRCYAVGLIPLLFQLQKVLDFKLFIYTDDLVPAVFTPDGFLENDIDIAWNNSNWANMLARLTTMEFNKQEDHLLIIDSLGSAGDSKWFDYWSSENVASVQAAQEQYLTHEWNAIRQYLNGNYNKINDAMMPSSWGEIVTRNCTNRWVNTPAMKQYLVRWLLHPQFGRTKHGTLATTSRYHSLYLSASVKAIRDQFASIHLLTPSFSERSRSRLNHIREHNFVDFHHEADTLEGVSKVFVNIVFRKETQQRLRTPVIQFSEYNDQVEQVEEEETGELEHSNLLKGSKCFSGCKDVNKLPETTFKLDKRKRGTYDVINEEIPFNELDVSSYSSYFFKNKLPSLEIKPSWSTFSKEQAAQEWLDALKSIELYCWKSDGDDGTSHEIYDRKRQTIPKEELDAWVDNINFAAHRTSALRPFVREMLDLYAPAYFQYMKTLPLQNVIWCTRGMFNHTKVTIASSVTTNKEEQQRVVWHEFAHYLNFVCPAINVFDNELLRNRTGMNGSDKKSDFIKLNQGEYALQPKEGQPDWIMPYAGKYYKRIHRHLCNDTEIIPCYITEFRTPSKIVTLFETDPDMAYFIAFVICGGPLAVLDYKIESKRRAALREIKKMEEQMTERAMRATSTKKRGRPKSSGNTSITTSTPSKPNTDYSFGL